MCVIWGARLDARGRVLPTVQEGKPVFFYTWADGTLTFAYPKGEVLYVVSASDATNAIAGLAALP